MRRINVGKVTFGGSRLVLIAGPCVIESEDLCLSTARRIKELAEKFKLPFVFKSSFDKANRLCHDSFRGPGIKKGLDVLRKVKEKLKVPVLSDVHSPEQAEAAKAVLDIIQIPALLCRQTDLLLAAAKTKKPVNIKKGQFLAPWDMASLIKKIESTGNKSILVTERGTSFGYNNLVSDFRSLKIMREFSYPIIYDATHSVQLPGGKGNCSGGHREFVEGLCRAAVAFGVDGLFLEVHPEPDNALCDGPNMIDFKTLEIILRQVSQINSLFKK